MLVDRTKYLAVAALCAAILGGPAFAGVKEGVDAWQAGDYVAAVHEWRPLADKGDADAQFNMGQAYKLGRGVPVDDKIAQSWFEKAAAQGHQQAGDNLGFLLYNGGDKALAMRWIRQSAARGDPRAQYILGIELFNGGILAKDWPRAYALMTRAAAQGLPPAADNLTRMDQMIPLADRQKGIAIARAMENGPVVTAAARPPEPRPIMPLRAERPIPRVPQSARPTAVPPRPAPVAVAGAGWRVQLGAFASPAMARGQWSSISARVGGLAGLRPSYEPAGALTRLRAGPLANRAAADRVCASAKAAGQACFPVAP